MNSCHSFFPFLLLADGVGNILSNNTANGALVESSEFSSFGDATQGLPPGRRTLWDGFVADSNGIDGIGVVATEGSRVLLEITSNRLAGSSNAHAGLNTNGDTTIALELQKHNRAGVPMYLWYAPGQTAPEVLPELLSIDLVTGLVEAAG